MAEPKILYKYLSAKGFQRLWDSEKVRFTQLNQLNDPYENRVLDPYLDRKIPELIEFSQNDEWRFSVLHQWETQSIGKHRNQIQNEFDNRFGILSLTRNPVNLLMWSHYAEEHKGVVIGIDVSNPIFWGEGIIRNPNEGSVIYSSMKPKGLKPIEIIRIKNDEIGSYSLVSNSKDKTHINDVVLYKSIDWSYEEEIRVVRDFNIEKGEVKVSDDGDEIMLFPLPKQAIKCVIFGERFDKMISGQFIKNNKLLFKEIDFLQASIDDYEYKINLNKIEKKEEIKRPIIIKGIMPRDNKTKLKKKNR